MAEEDKTMVEVEETPAGAKKPSPIKKYGLYAAIAVGVVLAAYLVTSKVIKPMLGGGAPATQQAGEKKEPPKEEKKEPAKEEKKESHGSHEAKSGHGEAAETAVAKAGDIYMIEQIVVNPAQTGGTRYLSASVGFELAGPEVGAILKEREAIVRDALISLLSSQTVPELSDATQRERLRKMIRLKVSKLLQTDEIAAVYFTEFVLQ